MTTLSHTIRADSSTAKIVVQPKAEAKLASDTAKKKAVQPKTDHAEKHASTGKDTSSVKKKPVVATPAKTVYQTKAKSTAVVENQSHIAADTAKPKQLAIVKDTIIPVAKVTVVKPTQPASFFQGHVLKMKHTNPMPINKEPADWIFFSLLLIVGTFTLTKVLHGRNIKQMRDAFFSTTISNQIIRDENLLFQRATVFLTVVFYLVSALLLYHISVVYNWNDTYISGGFGRFFIFVLFISLIYAVKLIMLKFIGFVLKIEKPVTAYIFNVFLVNNILGALLMPVLIALSYMGKYTYHGMLYIAFGLVACAYTYRLFRGVFMGVGNAKFSPYYLILYLCTLEIAPLVFFAKLLLK